MSHACLAHSSRAYFMSLFRVPTSYTGAIWIILPYRNDPLILLIKYIE